MPSAHQPLTSSSQRCAPTAATFSRMLDRDEGAARLQETFPGVSKKFDDAVIKTEVADVVTDDYVHPFGQFDLAGLAADKA